MKKLLLLCLFMSSFLGYAQRPTSTETETAKGSISGLVLDAELKVALPYVNIIVKDKDSQIITGSITSEDGKFKITNIPLGDINVSVQYIGFKTISKNIKISKDNLNVDMGSFLLEEEASSLDEVMIVAEVSTIQQKVDRKVINVGKDLTTSGASASDIMNNIPSVNVDAQTGSISLRGNENVRVMVDGKLSNIPAAQLLKQIPSTSIKSIELITNPSARYNPEGMSGIINIILHKNTALGFNGNVNFGLTKDINARFNSAIDLNYRNGKFNFYGNYGNNIAKSTNFGRIERLDDNAYAQEFETLSNNKSHLFKFGVDYYLDDNNTISVFTNQNVFDSKSDNNSDLIFPNQPIQNQISNSLSDNLSSQYNLVYKHKFVKEGETLDFEADYGDFDQNSETDYKFFNFVNSQNYSDFTKTKRQQGSFNLDYVNPLNDNSKLELGLEARLLETNIGFDSTGLSVDPNNVNQFIPTPSTDFDYERYVYSAYVTYGNTFDLWSYQVGARFENATDKAEALNFLENETEVIPFKNDYFQIYPSGFVTYTPSDKNSYQASVSRRVDRPGISQVNPIREWGTPLVSSFGNAELKPQFTNSLEINYTRKLKQGSITGGVFFRLIEDEINRANYIDRLDFNKSILTYDNFDSTTAYGIEISSNFRPTKWWSLNGSFDLYAQTQTGIRETIDAPANQTPTIDDILLSKVEVDNIAYNFRLNNNFKVTKSLTLSAFGFYRGPQDGIQFNSKAMYFVNTGLRYSFLDNAATFAFNYNDIFKTMKFSYDGESPYPQKGQFNWESNTWNISLSYRFGSGKYRSLQRKNRDKNETSGTGGFM